MSDASPQLAARAATLRLVFDRSFAEQRHVDTSAMESMLAIRVGPEPYALRLSEIAGLYVDRKITRLPSGATALLGFAGFRGAILPVYDLQTLLGRPASEAPRWLAIAAGASVALAFESFVGHLRVARQSIMAGQAGPGQARVIRHFISAEGVVRPVVDLAAVVETIATQRGATNGGEER